MRHLIVAALLGVALATPAARADGGVIETSISLEAEAARDAACVRHVVSSAVADAVREAGDFTPALVLVTRATVGERVILRIVIADVEEAGTVGQASLPLTPLASAPACPLKPRSGNGDDAGSGRTPAG